MEYKVLSNGVKMPQLGYGVYQVTKEECERCVLDALKAGYRLIDTAQSYFNEEEVGSAIKKSGVPREEIFLTTKVWIENYGYLPPAHHPQRLIPTVYSCKVTSPIGSENTNTVPCGTLSETDIFPPCA